MIKKILIGLLIVFVIIQFFRPAKNISTAAQPNDIAAVYAVPENVQSLLKRSCYDCHSNNTVYPWYSNIQPVAWWLNDHIKDGKRGVNFSEFGSFTKKRKLKKMKEVAEQVNKGEMPLDSYLWIHTYAKLSKDEVKLLADWAHGLAAHIDSTEKADPVDSKK